VLSLPLLLTRRLLAGLGWLAERLTSALAACAMSKATAATTTTTWRAPNPHRRAAIATPFLEEALSPMASSRNGVAIAALANEWRPSSFRIPPRAWAHQGAVSSGPLQGGASPGRDLPSSLAPLFNNPPRKGDLARCRAPSILKHGSLGGQKQRGINARRRWQRSIEAAARPARSSPSPARSSPSPARSPPDDLCLFFVEVARSQSRVSSVFLAGQSPTPIFHFNKRS
jgi:hypothetical protein